MMQWEDKTSTFSEEQKHFSDTYLLKCNVLDNNSEVNIYEKEDGSYEFYVSYGKMYGIIPFSGDDPYEKAEEIMDVIMQDYLKNKVPSSDFINTFVKEYNLGLPANTFFDMDSLYNDMNDFYAALSGDRLIEEDITDRIFVGNIFLVNIFYRLKLNELFDNIASEHHLPYNLTDIMEKVLAAGILNNTISSVTEFGMDCVDTPEFDMDDLYLAMPYIHSESRRIKAFVKEHALTILTEEELKKGTGCKHYRCVKDPYFPMIPADAHNSSTEPYDNILKANSVIKYIADIMLKVLRHDTHSEVRVKDLVDTMSSMDLTINLKSQKCYPAYMRTDITDLLHETYGFHTDYQIMDYDYVATIVYDMK